MSGARAGQPGATRQCPHCKAIVLESATVCPGCRHHLRFSSSGRQTGLGEAYQALSVDGTIAHRSTHEPCEYCIVLDITDERGEQLLRQVVGVGALQAGERRRLKLSIDMLPVVSQASAQPEPTARAAATPRSATPMGASPGVASAITRSNAAPSPKPAAAAAPTSTKPVTGSPAGVAAAAAPPVNVAGKAAGAGPLGQRLRIFRKS